MITKQITRYRYKALEQEEKELNERLEQYLDEQRKARDKGDLSENEEYTIATKNVLQSRKRLIEIAEELADVAILEVDKGPRITIGCKVQVTEVDAKGNPITEPRFFHLDQKGDTITEKVLGINSALGRAINNGTNGVYKIQTDMETIFYDVKKVIEK